RPCLQVNFFRIGHVIAPATVEDPDPFESHRSDGSMMAFPVGTLTVIVLPRPLASPDRTASPFVKCLPDELRASPAPMDPHLFATGLLHRSDAAERGDAIGRFEPLAPASYSGNQPRL